ncbi:MAG: hypothetical protein ACR2KK_08290, partial [Acidimicrobiales bacterium]
MAPTSTTAAPTSTTVASTSTTVPGTTTTQVALTTTTTTAPLTTTTTIAPVTQNRTVHVSPAMLAEATNPRVDISQFGSASAYYKPGPEAM